MTTLVSLGHVPTLPAAPELLEEAARDLSKAVRDIAAHTDDVNSQWRNLPQVFATQDALTLVAKMVTVRDAGEDFTEALSLAARAIEDLATSLAEAKARIETLKAEIPQLQQAVSSHRRQMEEMYDVSLAPDAEVWGSGQFLWNERLRGECARVETLIEQATQDCERTLRKVGPPPYVPARATGSHDAWGLPASVSAQHDRFEVDLAHAIFGRLASDGGSHAAALLAANRGWTDLLLDTPPPPSEVRAWWSGLDADTAQAIIAGAPLLVGNLNGVRLDHRISANRINIERAIQAENARVAQLRRTIAGLQGPGNDAVRFEREDQIAEINERIAVWQGLLDNRTTYFDENGEQQHLKGSQIVAFDVERQSIATYHGPIDSETGEIPRWIENVAVSVPGTGSNMESWADDRAADIYEGDRHARTAVFQWAGGAFPQDIPRAMSESYSHDLAPKLATFVNGLQTPGDSTVTVLGHSYGGATVGVAQAEGLRADRILYVAAAGLGDGNSGLDDFPHTGDVPQYAIMSRNDAAVGAIQTPATDWMHGPSTLSTPGIVRLETGRIDASDPDSEWIENYNNPGNWSPPAFDSHSTVYSPDSTSFANIMAVITGGEAELFAPDYTVQTGGRGPVTLPGYLASDYEPRYTVVE